MVECEFLVVLTQESSPHYTVSRRFMLNKATDKTSSNQANTHTMGTQTQSCAVKIMMQYACVHDQEITPVCPDPFPRRGMRLLQPHYC